MPKISVIVPVYKVESYIDRCVQSILGQTYKDFELILVDDGSPDNCGKICDKYQELDNRVIVIHQENQRLSAARNAGINIAKGEWLAFVDSDDWLHKRYLEILISGITNDTDVVICDCFITNNNIEQDEEFNDVQFINASIGEIESNRIARTRAWGRLIKKTSVGDLRYISGTEPSEDACFNELFFTEKTKFRITKSKLYYYYMRDDSAIHTHFGRGTLGSINYLLERLSKIDNIEQRRRIIKRCYKYIFSARYGEMFTEDYKDVLNRCNQLLIQMSPYLTELSLKDKIIFSVFSKSPAIYRVYRMLDDPTLHIFEAQKKIISAGKDFDQT